MKFAYIVRNSLTLSVTVSLAEIKNSNSDFKLISKRLRKVENTAEFPSWGIGRPGELISLLKITHSSVDKVEFSLIT